MDNLGLQDFELAEIFDEIDEQPAWRAIADKEMDYADGNQLDSELLARQRELGIPPAVEDLISSTLLSIQGYEANVRTDWRVSADGDVGGQDVADALNFRLNQAEKQSKADRACSAAFRSQIGCGIGWVEVGRERNPLKFPYHCSVVHRNEIYWDMSAQEEDLSDARWLLRRRYIAPDRLALMFPDFVDAIKAMGKHGANWRDEFLDGGSNTGLGNSWGGGGFRTLWERHWFDSSNKDLCVLEVWYRRWLNVDFIRLGEKRTVEFDANNPRHVVLLASGQARLEQATVSRLRRAFWVGDVLLHDDISPFPHQHFPYVRFVGFQEDLSGVPYGYVRGMKYAQDNLNSLNSKLRWGISVTRVERTKGAVEMSDAQLRRQIARPDADIVLNAEHMQRAGARFEVKRDYELNQQHWQMLNDNRNTIQHVSGITQSFMGKQGTANSGLQEQTQVEQSNQALGRMMDNFRDARSRVGELLLALIIEDLGREPQTIVIEGDAITASRSVQINQPERDPVTGLMYLSNDLQNTRLKVALEEVPSTTSYRSQQLNALSEVVKALPPEYQVAVLPFMVSLMDMPYKEQVIEKIKQVQQTPTPEQIQQQIDAAVQDALAKSGSEMKQAELAIKQKLADSQIKERDARAVQIGVQAAYAAMQAGAQVAQMPQIAPIADVVMQGAGYQKPNPMGDDPNFPSPSQAAAMNLRHPYVQGQGAQLGSEQLAQVRENTSPVLPPVPKSAPDGGVGIETTRTSDNLG
ncbi:hypothetical protein [Wielerella bovis]|uniref:portal protein n=1 Tax=Wielerella bovis TaxID=2917790 RepID=UPI0020188C27|nr:hypothetical protein [Wielerella bovis]ULJ66681.1 hypothetical protein MIS31_10600 [Wielerella bovis]